MKTSIERFGVLALVVTCVFMIFPVWAPAHDMWLEMQDYTIDAGEDLSLTLAYGHHFPARGVMDKDDLEEVYVLDGKGQRMDIKADANITYKTVKASKEEGTYLVVAKKKGGFFTKTTEGYKRGQSKKGLKNVIQCTYSAKYAKAIVNVGTAGGKAYSKVLGQDFEIVPMADPGTLAQGDYLPVKILFKGKPLASAQVLATYMGFSTEKNTFAYATKTDKAGVAKIKTLHYGVWLITASNIQDYPDEQECDQYKFSSSLTFEIR